MNTETKPSAVKLSSFAVPDEEASKLTIEVEFKDGMLFTVRYTSAAKLQSISQTSRYLQWNSAKKVREDVLDVEKFSRSLVKHSLVGWRGVTLRKLQKYVLLRDVPEEQLDAEIAVSPEEAAFLVQKIEGFDNWLIETARDPSLFSASPTQEAIAKNS